jgi:hypothetical protein
VQEPDGPRRAFIERSLPELWPTQASRDAAGGLRDLLRVIEHQQTARQTPEPARRGAPAHKTERGALPSTPMADCGVDLGRAPGQLQSGRLRGGRRPPSRGRGPVRTLLLPRLQGGVQIEGDDLTGGLLSLRHAMSRGLRPPQPTTGARRPPLHEPPSPEVEDGWAALRAALARGSLTFSLSSTGTLRLRYRSTELRVPLDWASRYLGRYLETRGSISSHQSRGPISGPGYVMDVFWPRFRDRTAGLPRRGGYGRLIGCWMLPYNEAEGLPPSLFFQGGSAQRAVHELMCQLTHAYASSARVPHTTTFAGAVKLIDDSGWCDHLSAFIEAVMEGEPVRALQRRAAYPDPQDNAPCPTVLINYADGDTGSLHATEHQQNPCYGLEGHPRGEAGPCYTVVGHCTALKATGTLLIPWDDYSIVLEDLSYGATSSGAAAGRSYTWFRAASASPDDGTPWPYPLDATATACSLGERRLLFQPAHLAFDAEVCDTLMFMAQLCLDYAKSLFRGDEPGWSRRALESVRAGQQFAQYALALIADRARLLVHELGHAYLGGSPHCGYDTTREGDQRWRSCFDVAARFLWAQVTAENGLPADTYVASMALSGTPSPESDFADRPKREGENERAFWVYKWANPFLSCQFVREGDEGREFSQEEFGKGPRTVCLGQYEVDLNAPGVWGGGFRFKTTDGCVCAAPASMDPSATVGWTYTTPSSCKNHALGARGVYYVPTT